MSDTLTHPEHLGPDGTSFSSAELSRSYEKAQLGEEDEPAPLTAETALVLRDQYNLPDVLSLATREGAHQQDPAVQLLIRSEQFRNLVLATDLASSATPTTIAGRSERRSFAYANRFLGSMTNMPTEMRQSFFDQVYNRVLDSQPYDEIPDENGARPEPRIDYRKFRNMLVRTMYALEGLDESGISRLQSEAGIEDFDYLNSQQATRMVDFLDGKPEVLEGLRQGDVTAVFFDAKGDPYGGMKDIGLFEGPNGRTLYFGVRKRADFNRERVLLYKRDIRASTIVIEGHGEPGNTFFGPLSDSFRLAVSSDQARERDLSIQDMDLPAMLNRIMQDSRGIDDHHSAIGRRRFILASCDGAKVEASSMESLLGAFVKKAATPNLDGYGAALKLSMLRTGNAISMRTVEDQNNPRSPEVLQDVIKLSLNDDGYLDEERLEELPLFKEPPKIDWGSPSSWGTLDGR